MAAIININDFKLSFTNEHTVYENYITAKIKENEFNLTYNPSLLQTSSNAFSEVKNFATGSDFQPYATTLGLYNDNNELLMVAKLGKPIALSSDTDMTFIVKYDT